MYLLIGDAISEQEVRCASSSLLDEFSGDSVSSSDMDRVDTVKIDKTFSDYITKSLSQNTETPITTKWYIGSDTPDSLDSLESPCHLLCPIGYTNSSGDTTSDAEARMFTFKRPTAKRTDIHVPDCGPRLVGTLSRPNSLVGISERSAGNRPPLCPSQWCSSDTTRTSCDEADQSFRSRPSNQNALATDVVTDNIQQHNTDTPSRDRSNCIDVPTTHNHPSVPTLLETTQSDFQIPGSNERLSQSLDAGFTATLHSLEMRRCSISPTMLYSKMQPDNEFE